MPTTDIQTQHLSDFMCICSAEPKATAQACLDRVCGALDCQPAGLLTAVVYDLRWGLDEHERVHADIENIAVDMWCLIQAKVYGPSTDDHRYATLATIGVQCDLMEHGIARVWELAKSAVPDLPDPGSAGRA